MANLLNQNQKEIGTIVETAAPTGVDVPSSVSDPRVEPWDLRRSGQIGREQLQAITTAHEGFARSLTDALGAHLRVVFAATLVSAEYLTYREFLHRIPETTYLAACRIDPMGVQAALQFDLKVAFPIIDLLLGGEGKSLAVTRELTEIEVQIFNSVARIVCRELRTAWIALALDVVFDERLDLGAAQRLMTPEEKILSLSFEVTMPEIRGGLNVAIPVSVSQAWLRRMAADWNQRRPRGAADSRMRLMRRLLDCTFELELVANQVRLPVRCLADLAPGTTLPFSRSASDPASLRIAGCEMFRALPARRGDTRAARIVERVNETTNADVAGMKRICGIREPVPVRSEKN